MDLFESRGSEGKMKSLAVFALSIFAFSRSFVEGADDVSCYVCMGRDMESCSRGKTECAGYCYKVVDTGHDLITKGCALVSIDNPSKPEKSDWTPEPHIKLYWTDVGNGTRDHVRGHTYFCKESMCNVAARNSVAFCSYFLIASLVVSIFLRR